MARGVRIAGAILVAALGLATVFAALETLAGEPPAGLGELLVDFLEALCLAAAMFGSALFVGRLSRVERETERLRADVGEAAAAGRAWRRQSQRLLDGLGDAIALQFRDWGLTEAESDVAGLIVKGTSLKEIARARSTSEATIRQQAQSVYRKSGLANRAELAAYFLDDLFAVGADAVESASERVQVN